MGGDPVQRGRVRGPGGIAQFLGLAPELVQAGPRRKRLRRHVISSPAPHGPRLGAEKTTLENTRHAAEADSVLPADPGAPSTRTVSITPGQPPIWQPPSICRW